MQDYKGADVTAQNFLSVLAGKQPAVIGSSGKVIKAGPHDRIFVFYADHGAPGLDFPQECYACTKRRPGACSPGCWTALVRVLMAVLPFAGILGMPSGPFLYADQLIETLHNRANRR